LFINEEGRLENAGSFIIQDNLYVYGGDSEAHNSQKNMIFMLNLISMRWQKIPQTHVNFGQFQGDINRGHLFALRHSKQNKNDVLIRCNIETNSFSTAEIKELDSKHHKDGNFVIYKNMLFTCRNNKKEFSMYVLNLQSIDSFAIKSDDEKHLISRFMNQEGSDITFQIEGQTIPAHEEVLIKKCPDLAKLFERIIIGLDSYFIMIDDSKQEIKDCEFLVFQGIFKLAFPNDYRISAIFVL